MSLAKISYVTAVSIANEQRSEERRAIHRERKRSVAADVAHGGPGKSRSTPGPDPRSPAVAKTELR